MKSARSRSWREGSSFSLCESRLTLRMLLVVDVDDPSTVGREADTALSQKFLYRKSVL